MSKIISSDVFKKAEKLFFDDRRIEALKTLDQANDVWTHEIAAETGKPVENVAGFIRMNVKGMAAADKIDIPVKGLTESDIAEIRKRLAWTCLNNIKPDASLLDVLEGKDYYWDDLDWEERKKPITEKKKAVELLRYLQKLAYRQISLDEALARNTDSNRMILLIQSVGDTPTCVREAYYVDTVSVDNLPPHGTKCRCAITPTSERLFFSDQKYVRNYGQPK